MVKGISTISPNCSTFYRSFGSFNKAFSLKTEKEMLHQLIFFPQNQQFDKITNGETKTHTFSKSNQTKFKFIQRIRDVQHHWHWDHHHEHLVVVVHWKLAVVPVNDPKVHSVVSDGNAALHATLSLIMMKKVNELHRQNETNIQKPSQHKLKHLVLSKYTFSCLVWSYWMDRFVIGWPDSIVQSDGWVGIFHSHLTRSFSQLDYTKSKYLLVQLQIVDSFHSWSNVVNKRIF